MKVVGKKLKGEATGFKTMPNDMRDKLKDLTINESIERGFVTDLGDEDGKFIFPHADDESRAFAIINGYTVPISKGLNDKSQDEILEVIGDLRFNSGISTIEGDGFGKTWFRLSLPAYVNLSSEATVTLDAETVGNPK